MKNVFIFSIALFTGLVVSAQKIVPSSNVITEQRTVLNFSQINAASGIEVVIVFGGTEKVEIQAPDNVIQYVETVTEKNLLNIRLRKGVNIRGNVAVKVLVGVKSLTKITASSGSKISIENMLAEDKLDISLSNASLTGSVSVQKASLSLSKKSHVDLSGSCKELKLSASGGSSAGGTKFTVEVLKAKLSGGSTARLTVTQSIDFEGAKGSNLHYAGNPKLRKIKASGDSGLYRAE